ELPGRRGADRNAALTRGDSDRGPGTSSEGVQAVETRAGLGIGAFDTRAARPALVPQGLLPLPFLHPPRGYGAPSGMARPRPSDRSTPVGTPSVDLAHLASQGSSPAAVFFGDFWRRRPRPVAVLARVPRGPAPEAGRTMAAPPRLPQMAALSAA